MLHWWLIVYYDMLCCIGEWICSFYNFFFWESKWVQPTLGAICALVTYSVGGRSVCKPFNFFMWVFFGWHYYWSYIIRDVNEVELWYNRILSYFILHKSEGETSLGCEVFHLCIGIFILIYIYYMFIVVAGSTNICSGEWSVLYGDLSKNSNKCQWRLLWNWYVIFLICESNLRGLSSVSWFLS